MFCLLGRLEVRTPTGSPVIAPRRKQRALLAILVLRSGTVVATEEIVDALWGERAPTSARANLHSYVSGLRTMIAALTPATEPRLQSTPNGYRLAVNRDECDALIFEDLAAAGKRALAAGRHAEAAERLARALGLWRGGALEGLEPFDWLLPYVTRLEEARLAALEDQIDARLALGQHEDLAVELASIRAQHPLRERLGGQHMTALHRSGRRGEALDTYNRLCDALDAEYGVEPSAGLRRLHREIRANDSAAPAAPARPAPVAAAPALLPPDIPDFTGRLAELDFLGGVLRRDGHADHGALTVAGIAGMAGVGKTTVAVHVAHRVAAGYPDGQLYVNLRGAEATSLDAGDVLARFLLALGVDSRAVPADTAGRAELYRTLMAGRRVLVVLDNAGSEEQVRPLLPGSASCVVLVTGRRRLTGVEGVRWIDLDVFDDEEAVRLFARVVDDHRVASQPAEAGEIVRLCGGLPLAVRVVAARLTARPAWRLEHLVRLLADERGRLDMLATGDLAVRASLALSYAGLGAEARRLFRLLGLFDVSDFPAWLAAPLLDGDLEHARAHVESLVDAQLLSDAGVDSAGQLRYRFHDLVRLFARECAERDDDPAARQAALDRGFGAYLAMAERMADRVPGPCYAAIRGPAPRQPVPWDTAMSPTDAMLWFDAERPALRSAIRQACHLDLDEFAYDLAGCMEKYFDMRGMYADWEENNRLAMAACRRAGNKRGEAVMMRGIVYLNTRASTDLSGQGLNQMYEGAVRLVEMFTALGHRKGMSDAIVMVSWALSATGQHAVAVEHAERGLRLAEETGHTGGLARAHSALALAYSEQRRLDCTVLHLRKALDAARTLTNARYEATVLLYLGIAHQELGQLDQSEQALDESLAISRRYRDRYAETLTLLAVARLHMRRRDPRARAAVEAALDLARMYHMNHQVADALGLLGQMELAEGRRDEAIACMEDSVAVWRTWGWLSYQAAALTNLGRAYAAAAADRPAARGAFAEARDIYSRLHRVDRVGELTRLLHETADDR